MGRRLHGYLRFAKRALGNRRGTALAVLLTGLLLSFFASFSPFSLSESTQDLGPGFSDLVQNPPMDAFAFSTAWRSAQSDRPIFPYSVVPGGVHNLREVREAITSDPAVAKHYSVLKLEKLHLIRLNKPLSLHVSYRVGGNIYWTRRELHLAEGEPLLSDGENAVRTRCGNLVSKSPRPPNSPMEPTPVTFDTPLIPPPPPDGVPPLIFTPGGGSGIFPPVVPIFPGGGPSKHPHHPPVHVPEPGTLVLLVAGLAVFRAMSKVRNRQRFGADPGPPR